MMSKLFFLQRVGFLALIFTALLAPRAARASHALGADMSYTSVAPGVYYVSYRFYRDCTGIAAPTSFTMNYEATGCGPTGSNTNAGGSLDLLPRASQIANPYCRQQNLQSPCDSMNGLPSNGLPNFFIFTYSNLLTLGTGQASRCSEWVLSVAINARPDTRNLGYGTDLFTSILLNNVEVVDDSAPAFSTLGGLQPLAVMYENTLIRYNSGVIDPDGDSLVYSMQQPQVRANTVIPYVNGFTLQEPLRTQVGTPPPYLDRQGTLEFTAGPAVVGSTNDVDNKFALVIQVESWRRINGQPVLLARVQRDIAAIIVASPNGPNEAPAIFGRDSSIMVIRSNHTEIINYGDTIFAYVGEQFGISTTFRDINGDSIFLEMPPTLSPAGSIFLAGRLSQSGRFTYRQAQIFWTPTQADARPQGHQFLLRASDNGCPAKANSYFPLTVMVAPLRPTGLAAAATKKPLIAYPNPFTADIRLTINQTASDGATAVQIYDVMGRLVDQLAVAKGNGTQTLTWHPSSTLSAGQYRACYRGKAGQQQAVLVKQ